MGWVCGMTGVGFILSGYLGGLFGWNMSQTEQILRRHRRGFLCVLINIYGVRFATMVNNIGVSLEFVVTVVATAFVAIIAFSAPENHQPISVLFTGGIRREATPTSLAWLAAALGPFFGLIGVESGADVAEETKNARYVVPKTMFYALVTSIVIELLMYIVYVLAIRDAGRRAGQYRGADRGDHQPAGRPGRHENRCRRGPDEHPRLPAGQHPGRHPADLLDGTRQHAAVLPCLAARVADQTKTPTYAVIGLGCLSTVLLLSALVNEKAFNYIIGIASLLFFLVYILQTIGLLVAVRRGTIPRAGARHLRPRPRPRTAVRHLTGGVPRRLPSRCSSCPSSPATGGYSWALSCWPASGGRPACASGCPTATPDPDFAKTHLS